MARPHAKTIQEAKERAWRHLSPAIDRTRYVYWRSGKVPDRSPAWAVNAAPPPIAEVIREGGFCQAAPNLICRELGLEIPTLGDDNFDGGIVAAVGCAPSGPSGWPREGYYQKRGILKRFNKAEALKRPWTLLYWQYVDASSNQGHVMILLRNGQLLEWIDATGTGKPGLTTRRHVDEVAHLVTHMVYPEDWMLPKGAAPGPGGGDKEELFTVEQLAEISQNPDPAFYDLAGDRAALVPEMKKAGIATKERIAAFLGNVCQETDRLKTLEEYGDEAYFRSFLGNEWRYHGRGYMMNTWRAAYQRLSGVLGVDLVANPNLLSERKDLAAKAAVWFWTQNGLADYADAGNFRAVAAIINTGSPNGTPNGWPERKAAYDRAMRILPETGPVVPTKPRLKPNLVAVGQLDEEAMHACALVFRRRGFDVTSTRGEKGVAAFDGIFGTEPLGTRQMVVIGGPALRALSPASRSWVYSPPNFDVSDYVGAVGDSCEDTLSLVEGICEAYVGKGSGAEFRAVLGAHAAPVGPVKPPVPVSPVEPKPEEEEPVQPTEPTEPVAPVGPPGPDSKNPKTPAHEPVLYARLASAVVALGISYGLLGAGEYPELTQLIAGFLAWLAADSGISVAVRQLVRPVAKGGGR